jgi:hypothetical protein
VSFCFGPICGAPICGYEPYFTIFIGPGWAQIGGAYIGGPTVTAVYIGVGVGLSGGFEPTGAIAGGWAVGIGAELGAPVAGGKVGVE